jgi:hypothetical protein
MTIPPRSASNLPCQLRRTLASRPWAADLQVAWLTVRLARVSPWGNSPIEPNPFSVRRKERPVDAWIRDGEQ